MDILTSTGDSPENGLDTLEVLKNLSAIVATTSNLSGNKVLSRAVTGLSLAISVVTVGRQIYDATKKRNNSKNYVVRISEMDPIFVVAEKWLNDAVPADQQKSIFLRTSSSPSLNYDSSDDVVASPTNTKKSRAVQLSQQMDGTMVQQATIDGYPVTISTSSPAAMDEKLKKNILTARSIMISCNSFEARDAVIKKLENEAQKLNKAMPTFHMSTSWGGFRHVSDIPKRPLESVILKDGQMERIIDFMRRFLDNEEEYVRLGVPYRTGMLLYGNPGSGKSSTASAIAHELGLNIYYISLSGLDGDDALSRALNEIPPYSLAILEDVDVYNAVKARPSADDIGGSVPDEGRGVTLAGMLNVLDGFTSPHGVITVMTTNHIEALDPAIIRPGRVDLREELNELDTDQLERMCKYFIGFVPEGLPELTPEDGITSAQIVGVIRNHIPHVEQSANDIVSTVKLLEGSFTK
jgi:hypothetical protein